MEITLRKPNKMFLQRKRVSGMALNWDAVLRTSWRHEEASRNDLLTRKSGNSAEMNSQKWQAGGKARFIYLPPGYNNDPCIKHLESMTYVNFNVQVKLSLIDLEGYGESYADKAQATERCAA